jgi:molybdopterin-binding protein
MYATMAVRDGRPVDRVRTCRLDPELQHGEVILVKLSARNQFPATVRSVTEGAVMSEVTVEVDGGHELVAAITAASARRLGLAPGKRVVAIIKSTEVILATED